MKDTKDIIEKLEKEKNLWLRHYPIAQTKLSASECGRVDAGIELAIMIIKKETEKMEDNHEG